MTSTTKQAELISGEPSHNVVLPDETIAAIAAIGTHVSTLLDLPVDERVEALNRIRTALHRVSPFEDPVDLVLWVKSDRVVANDYNPNHVAPPEMKLLALSILEDGYTQPIVTFYDEEQAIYIVVDGFHRSRVGREVLEIRKRLYDYLPVVVIDKTLGERMASTTRHNRARGKHQVDLMGDLVRDLVQKGWGDARIAKHLGMSPEELLRLKQIVGIAKIFAAPDYSKSWGDINEHE